MSLIPDELEFVETSFLEVSIFEGKLESIDIRKDWTYQRSNHKRNFKKINNGRQKTKQKTEDWAKRTQNKTEGELKCSVRVTSFCSSSGTRRVTVEKKIHEK
jgi:hypothetical protein